MATGISSSPRLLETVRNILVTYKGTVGEPVSLADISKIARVEPITLISSSLAGTKELYEILHGVLNIYAGYYLQAVHILSAQLADVRILKILDKTNPDRDLKTLLTAGSIAFEDNSDISVNIRTLSLENCKFKLPMISTEDMSDETPLFTSVGKLNAFEKLGSAVGKVIDVRFTTSGSKSRTVNSRTRTTTSEETPDSVISIPVVVKLDNMLIPSDVISAIVTANADDISLSNRFKDVLSGRIEFIKDFILASDLIKTHKKTMIKDPTGYYSQILKRINNSRIYSALSGNISLAGISSIVVLSEQEEQSVQRLLGGKLSNRNTREIIFNNTSAMMLVVVDREWSRVSIYVKDVDGHSEASFDSFKSQTDKNSSIHDILKSLVLGNSPSF